MVAGYAIGGGHVLHVVCDLTIAADNARFGQTGPKVGSFDGGFGAGAARRPGRAEEGQGDLVPLPPVRRRARRSTWASSTPWCRSRSSRRRPCAGAARCSRSRPFALRLLKASFNAAEDGLAGIQQLAHDANLLFYMSEEAQEGRDAYREKRRAGLREVPASGLEPRSRLWLLAARPRTLPGGGGARCSWAPRSRSPTTCSAPLAFVAALVGSVFIQIGTNLSNDYSDARRGADTEDRLGPVRVTAGGLMPPRRVLVGHLRRLRRRRGGRARTWPPWRAGSCWWSARLDPRRRALHRRSAALRLRGPRRDLRVPLLRRRRRGGLLLRADRGARAGRRSRSRCRSGLLAAAILVVNNVRDVDTDRRAGKRTLAVQARARARPRRSSRRCWCSRSRCRWPSRPPAASRWWLAAHARCACRSRRR